METGKLKLTNRSTDSNNCLPLLIIIIITAIAAITLSTLTTKQKSKKGKTIYLKDECLQTKSDSSKDSGYSHKRVRKLNVFLLSEGIYTLWHASYSYFVLVLEFLFFHVVFMLQNWKSVLLTMLSMYLLLAITFFSAEEVSHR